MILRAASDGAAPLLQRQLTCCRDDRKQGVQEPQELDAGRQGRLTLQPARVTRAQPQLQSCHRNPATLSPAAACCRTPPASWPHALAAEGARRGTAGRAALPHAPQPAFETATTEQETLWRLGRDVTGVRLETTCEGNPIYLALATRSLRRAAVLTLRHSGSSSAELPHREHPRCSQCGDGRPRDVEETELVAFRSRGGGEADGRNRRTVLKIGGGTA